MEVCVGESGALAGWHARHGSNPGYMEESKCGVGWEGGVSALHSIVHRIVLTPQMTPLQIVQPEMTPI